MKKNDIKQYTDLNAQMERLGCIIRQIFLFEDNNNMDEEIKFICDFVDDMILHERIEDLTEEHQELFYKYVHRIGDEKTLKEIAPDIKI